MANDEGVSPEKIAKFENMSDDDEDESNLTYEQLREKRMRENKEMLNLSGVNQAVDVLSKSLKVKQPVKKTSVKGISKSKNVIQEPTRRSLRIAKIPLPSTITELNTTEKSNANDNENMYDSDIINTESISIPEADTAFFEKLSADLVIKKPVNDFHNCDFERFTKVLKSLEINEKAPLKVINGRIYSLAVHPSETSLLIAAGSWKGNVALYDKNNFEGHEYRVHDAPVNCISFCTWDPFKLFSTSFDGSVRCGDIVKRTFDVIYTLDLRPKNIAKSSYTTWHTEYERNILVGNGSGRVDLIDIRSPNKVQNSAWCHERSVRTIQCHPLENYYYLTSSALKEVALWDVRNMNDSKIDPVLLFSHPKAMTSAFFSASGTNMVSTCNDDNIRIFNTSRLTTEALKPVHKIQHNNHTGRWLSVFKAKWHPGRDDIFFVGSMQVPKRIQIYRSNGNLLHDLTSENMSTYCPVIEAHPTQAIYVGGNKSGRMHVFSTEEQFKSDQ